MTYHPNKCIANCSFCPQAQLSSSKTELLSRVTWPTFSTETVTGAVTRAYDKGTIKRVCIQALNYSGVFSDIEVLVKKIKHGCSVPVSVSCQPLNKENIESLKTAGVNRLGIALDAATKAIFDKVKGAAVSGCYSWDRQLELFEEALTVFGKGNVSTHLILGLGESEREAVKIIQWCVNIGVLPALFAFTPVRGTALEENAPPKLGHYRRVQLARYLIANDKAKSSDMTFGENGEIKDFGLAKETLKGIINGGTPFQTSGCPNCNRPYYNEKPSGPIYNYPKTPNKKDIEKIKAELE